LLKTLVIKINKKDVTISDDNFKRFETVITYTKTLHKTTVLSYAITTSTVYINQVEHFVMSVNESGFLKLSLSNYKSNYWNRTKVWYQPFYYTS